VKREDRFPFEILFLILAAAMFFVVCLRFSWKIDSLDKRITVLEEVEKERIEKLKKDPLKPLKGLEEK
jgi:hypothetical protein